MIKVLVFPCGSEIGLEVHNALKFDKHVELFGLSSVPCHGSMVYKNYIEGISFIDDPNFLDELNEIVDDNEIDIIIPAYDDVILYLAKNEDKLHCKLATSSYETCDVARSKIKTYEILKDEDFTPKMYTIDQVNEDILPLFAKPDIGQGSQGIAKIETMQDLEQIRDMADEYVISEMLPGQEYTIDCFTDSKGELLVASMRQRKRIRTGISVNSITYATPDDVMSIAKRINDKFKFDGVWFFQVKEDINGKFKLLEMAPRVAGSMSTSRVRGFNFILNTVYQKMGYEVTAIPFNIDTAEVDRAFSNKYKLDIDYDTVYVDFDDTVTYGNTVNVETIAFLYQCLNKKIKIKLLTRHAKEIYDSLAHYRIDKNLFDEIIHIKDETTPKSEYVTDEKAIFIDDSFRERKDVAEKCGIPVFDCDAISALMDYRY